MASQRPSQNFRVGGMTINFLKQQLGVCHESGKSKQSTRTMEQRQDDWSKIATKTERNLAIRIRLQMAKRTRELALFNLAIDSKLRGCNLVKLKVCDVSQGGRVSSRAIIMQQKTHRPVQFEITEQTRDSLAYWISQAQLKSEEYLFPSRIHDSPHLSTRQYARIVEHWVTSIGLDPAAYGTHTMRRTKATLVYRRTKNLRAVQLLLGHT